MGALIAIEGGDGAGKSTQHALLRRRLEAEGYPVHAIHFPRLEATVYGELIGAFLRGELGRMDQVAPKLVALLYASDQSAAQDSIRQHLEAGGIVLLDRYYASNLAYQGAKVAEGPERETLLRWILRLELEHLGVRPADMTLCLHVPRQFSVSALAQRAADDAGATSCGGVDIHEQDSDFQGRVCGIFDRLADYVPHYHVLNCGTPSGGMMPREVIHELIYTAVKRCLPSR